MGLGMPPLNIKNMTEPTPGNSRFSARELTARVIMLAPIALERPAVDACACLVAHGRGGKRPGLVPDGPLRRSFCRHETVGGAGSTGVWEARAELRSDAFFSPCRRETAVARLMLPASIGAPLLLALGGSACRLRCCASHWLTSVLLGGKTA